MVKYTKCPKCGKKGMHKHADYKYMKKHGMKCLLPKRVCKYCGHEQY